MALSLALMGAGHESSIVLIQDDPLNKNRILKALKKEGSVK